MNSPGNLNEKYNVSTYSNDDTEEDGYDYTYYEAQGNDEEHYQIQIALTNNNNQAKNKIKKIKVTVFYSVGNKEKSIDISTIINNS